MFAVVTRSFPRNTYFRRFLKFIFFIFFTNWYTVLASLQLQILKGKGVPKSCLGWSPFSYCTVPSEIFARWLLRRGRMEDEKGRCWEKKEPEIWVCVDNHWGFVLQAFRASWWSHLEVEEQAWRCVGGREWWRGKYCFYYLPLFPEKNGVFSNSMPMNLVSEVACMVKQYNLVKRKFEYDIKLNSRKKKKSAMNGFGFSLNCGNHTSLMLTWQYVSLHSSWNWIINSSRNYLVFPC